MTLRRWVVRYGDEIVGRAFTKDGAERVAKRYLTSSRNRLRGATRKHLTIEG